MRPKSRQGAGGFFGREDNIPQGNPRSAGRSGAGFVFGCSLDNGLPEESEFDGDGTVGGLDVTDFAAQFLALNPVDADSERTGLGEEDSDDGSGGFGWTKRREQEAGTAFFHLDGGKKGLDGTGCEGTPGGGGGKFGRHVV